MFTIRFTTLRCFIFQLCILNAEIVKAKRGGGVQRRNCHANEKQLSGQSLGVGVGGRGGGARERAFFFILPLRMVFRAQNLMKVIPPYKEL